MMESYGILFLLCVAVFAVTCKPARNDAKENREKLVQTLQDEINKLNKQMSELKDVYKDAAKKSIEKAMADEKEDAHVETATIEKVVSKDASDYHFPSVEDSLKEAFADVKRIAEAPAIKAEDIPSKIAAPKQPTMIGVKEGDEKKEVPIDDYDDDFDVADYTGIDFDEFLDEGEKKDAANSMKKSMSQANAPHQNGPTHDIVNEKEDHPKGAMNNAIQSGPTHDAVTEKGEKKDEPSDEPSAKELAHFFGDQPGNAKTSDEGAELSPEVKKEMLADDEDADSDARLDESEEVKRKENAKQEFDNLSDQLRDVRTDIAAIGKDFGGMRNDYQSNKIHHPLSADAKSKLQELKDDFKEIISEFKEMANELPKNANGMNDEEYDRADASKPQYTNDEMEVLVNDMKNELTEVAKKMKVVKDAVMKHDTKEDAEKKARKGEKMAKAVKVKEMKHGTKEENAEEKARKEEKEAEAVEAKGMCKGFAGDDAPRCLSNADGTRHQEPRKSDEAKAKMEGLQDELKDIMKEAKGLRAEVLEQRSKNEKRDQETIDKQMQEMRDLRDEVTTVRTEMKSLEDGKKHA